MNDTTGERLTPETLGILRCPVCGGRLDLTESVRCSDCGRDFPRSKGLPVLIDFDDSIFRPADYATPTGTVVPRLQKGSRIGAFLGKLTYGENQAAERNIARFIEEAKTRNPRPLVLVVGGGSIGSGVGTLYADADVEIVGADVYASPNIALICDGHKLPFADASFDGVLIQAVLEHVLEPHRVVDEIHRVLKPAGVVYAETPFMQQVHEQAYDFTRFTHAGHRWLFRRFREIEAGSVLGPGIALLWSIAYFVKAKGGSRQLAALITAPFFWLRLLDRKVKRGPALDAASGLFFLGARSEEALKANQLPGYYDSYR